MNKTAMSLVETLFCASIFVLILGACMALLFRGWDSWNVSSAQAQMTQELTQSTAWLTRDINQSGVSAITNVPADNNIYSQITLSKVLNVASGGVVNWDPLAVNYSLGGAKGQQLIRTQNSQARVVAMGITALRFSRQAAAPNIVNVQLTASVPTHRGNQQLTATLNIKVSLHNS